MSAPQWSFLQKFCILGDSGIGKTSLLVRLTGSSFSDVNEPTIGVDFGAKLLSLDSGEKIKLQIWDTSGQETFRSITKSYFRGAEGCLLVFDITHRPSFINCRTWMHDIQQFAPEDVVVMLIANKMDLITGDDAVERAVSEEEAFAFANELGIEYAETSAKNGRGVQEAFEAVAKSIHARTQASRAAKKREAAAGRSFPLSAGDMGGAGKCC